jgi:hypothetical protein
MERQFKSFFEQLGNSPMYKKHVESYEKGGVENSLFQRTGSHIQKRIHSFAFYMLGVSEKWPTLKFPSSSLEVDLINLGLNFSPTGKESAKKVFDLTKLFLQEYLPIFFNEWCREGWRTHG